jgi:hypothetical protein
VTGTTGKGAALACVRLEGVAQPATVVADTTGEAAALASVPSVGVGSATVLGSTTVEGAALASVRFVGVAKPATVVEGMTSKGAALASVRSFGVASASHCGGGHESPGRCSGFCSLVRHGLSQPLCWRARKLMALLWLLYSRSA